MQEIELKTPWEIIMMGWKPAIGNCIVVAIAAASSVLIV